MINKVQFTGKSVDEAVFKGLTELGLSIDEVDVVVVQRETHGILGIGSKPAIVELTQRESMSASMVSDVLSDAPVEMQEKQPETTEKRRPPVPDELPKCKATPELPRRTERVQHDSMPRPQHRVESTEPEPDYQIPEQGTVPAVDYLCELLRKMGIDAVVKCATTDEIIRITIESESEMLIGHHGKTLDALQYVTLLAINNKDRSAERTRITIDVHGYRKRREEQLIKLARSKASMVKGNGRPFKFEPMNPYERRIIHSALQGHNFVETHSEGEEPNRYVIIALKPGVSPRRSNGYRGYNQNRKRNA